MKTKKLIAYNIITLILILNSLFLFFGEGLDRFSTNSNYLKNLFLPILMISILFFLNFLVNYSYISSSAIHKKNLLRITGVTLMIILIISIISRITELFVGKFMISLWLNTILYFILLILTISILKNLYKLISKLFKNN